MHWFPVAVATGIAFCGYNVFLKLAAGHIDQVLGALVLQVVAALAGAVVLGVWYRVSSKPLEVSSTGLGYAALAGLCVSAAEILAFVVFAAGAPVSLGAPVILGGTVLYSAFAGVLVLREAVTLSQMSGAVLIVGGVALLSSEGVGKETLLPS